MMQAIATKYVRLGTTSVAAHAVKARRLRDALMADVSGISPCDGRKPGLQQVTIRPKESKDAARLHYMRGHIYISRRGTKCFSR